MTDQTLLALAERCEQASGPDPQIDLAIARIVNGTWGARPRYTSSLEAAMELVPAGWEWATGTGRRAHMTPDGRTPWAWCVRSEGFALPMAQRLCATPALALTAAALRAHAIRDVEEGS